jgi:pimeloyl-ACP methyl ester carboxylesterase
MQSGWTDVSPREGLCVRDGARLRYLEWGERGAGHSVVALHGFGQTADFLSPFVDELTRAGAAHVVAPDLRAHGDSDDFSSSATAAMPADVTFVEDALTVWRATIDAEAIWFGNSLGSRVAGLTAARHPEVAGRLVLGECMAGLEDLWAMMSAATRRYASARPAFFPSTEEARAFAEKVRRDKGPALELWLAHGIKATPEGMLVEKLRTRFLDKVYWPSDASTIMGQLERIGVPVTLAYAANGSAVSPPNQERVRQFFQHARIEHIGGAGHNLFLDAPAAVARLVLPPA